MATIAKQSSAKQAAQTGVAGWVNNVATWPTRFRVFVDGLKREMRLVTWPSKEQVQATTLVVIVTIFLFAVFFAITDYLLGTGFRNLFQYFLP
jgi:preprotein translocase subunit SecE